MTTMAFSPDWKMAAGVSDGQLAWFLRSFVKDQGLEEEFLKFLSTCVREEREADEAIESAFKD